MGYASERDIAERFADRYRDAQSDVTRSIELEVIGADWGANGYTTRAEADLLGRELGCGEGVRLLDLGAGRGWPGLYLAASTRCSVVLVDVPIEGLAFAMRRAAQERLAGHALAASARRPPFRPASFDAIVHTDVLCCLRPKLSVLRTCRRLLRPGGVTAFTTIHPAGGLGTSQRRRASRDGPIAVATSRSYREMLESAGFVVSIEADRTVEFARTARAWIEQWDLHRDALTTLFGAASVEERQTDRRAQLAAVEDGILRRSLFVARRPA